MEMMKLAVMASTLAALVGCADAGLSGTAGTPATSSQNATSQNTPQPPAMAYKPYICDQGGEHNC